jgi:transcription-repair coupling factor (superfamily II helicase)
MSSALSFARDLSLFLGGVRTYYYPPAESSPYEQLTPDPDSAAMRICAMTAMRFHLGPVVVPSMALLQPVPPPDRLANWTIELRPGQEIDRDKIVLTLINMGYRREAVATQTGDLAVRGGILDVFSPALKDPVRIEFWDDRIHSLRKYDAQTQRSGDTIEMCALLPVRDLLLETNELNEAKSRLSGHLAATGVDPGQRSSTISTFEDGLDLPGGCLLLPLLYGEAAYPTDHFSSESLLLLHEFGETRALLTGYLQEAETRWHSAFPLPEKVYARFDDTVAKLFSVKRILTGMFDLANARQVQCLAPLPSSIPVSRPDRVAELVRLLEREEKGKVIIFLHSTPAADRLRSVLRDMGKDVRVAETFQQALAAKEACIVTGRLSAGFYLPGENLRIISDADLFGPSAERKSTSVTFPEWDLPIGSLTDGDVVVHIDHGIARYSGLKQLNVAGSVDDFLHLLFEGGDSLYVPVWQMNRVQIYRSGSERPPSLSKLGSASWKRSKTRVRKSLRLMAEELLRISAVRQDRAGHEFPAPDHIFREFEVSFPWTETPDQERTISEVITDMTSPTPMDRLVCGDVGFGKTEVALRAAFLAAMDGKQTAVLVPTTVLAQQHYQNFKQRLRDFPVTIGLLSRFVPVPKQKSIVESLSSGKLDIVIGTHRLLSRDIMFHDLGLAIIDEEHRFGVRHKEKLKNLRETVDVLTLSATPIPRTLFQAFSGLRSLSLIHTPPADRKSIHTEVRYYDEDLIREAVEREMDRGGQTFFVHNRVSGIESLAYTIRGVVPQARVAVAHGQMGEKQLEEVMVGFLNHDFDVLVTTAIIESGLDIANANTLIVNRADRFGLAQLYQLRGRVGRSSVLAYAYLLIPPQGAVTRSARQRLRSLRELTELGSGFRLASYDLEMRGAGNLLGEEQSGRIDTVGLELYSQFLEQAVREAAGQETEPEIEPAITLPIPSFLPESYLPDVGERLTLYKRLASVTDMTALGQLREETMDRFGRFTKEVEGLFTRMEVQITARDRTVDRIDAAGPYMLVVFHPRAKISPDVLVNFLTSDRRLAFVPPTTLKLEISGFSKPSDQVSYLLDILRSL